MRLGYTYLFFKGFCKIEILNIFDFLIIESFEQFKLELSYIKEVNIS